MPHTWGMVPVSVKRLVVEIDTSSVNVAEFCRSHAISPWFFYDLRRRYLVEGEAVFEPKSTAPHTVWNKTPAVMEDLIVQETMKLEQQQEVVITASKQGIIVEFPPL